MNPCHADGYPMPAGINRRCGTCCGAPSGGDQTSSTCQGATSDGGLYITQAEARLRCENDATCTGFGWYENTATNNKFARLVYDAVLASNTETNLWKTYVITCPPPSAPPPPSPPSPPPPSPPPTMGWFWGEMGENCSTTCARYGQICDSGWAHRNVMPSSTTYDAFVEAATLADRNSQFQLDVAGNPNCNEATHELQPWSAWPAVFPNPSNYRCGSAGMCQGHPAAAARATPARCHRRPCSL